MTRFIQDMHKAFSVSRFAYITCSAWYSAQRKRLWHAHFTIFRVHGPHTHERGMTHNSYWGGMLPNPFTIGLRSISLGSTRDFKQKCCSTAAKNRNNSMRARPSPTHTRFPRVTTVSMRHWDSFGDSSSGAGEEDAVGKMPPYAE